MVKNRTVKEDFIVCDICGEEVPKTADFDSYQWDYRYHACQKHREFKVAMQILEDNGLQDLAGEMVKRVVEGEKNEEKH